MANRRSVEIIELEGQQRPRSGFWGRFGLGRFSGAALLAVIEFLVFKVFGLSIWILVGLSVASLALYFALAPRLPRIPGLVLWFFATSQTLAALMGPLIGLTLFLAMALIFFVLALALMALWLRSRL